MKKKKKVEKETKVKKKLTKKSTREVSKTPKKKKTKKEKRGTTKKVVKTTKVKVKPVVADVPELTEADLQDGVVLAPTTKKGYLSNKSLLHEIAVSKKLGRMSNALALMLKLLCDRYAKKANFIGYTFNEDMRAFALLMLVRMWDRFDPKRSDNPFAYFTQCIKNSFKQFLNQEKKQRDIRDELLVNQGMLPSYTYMGDYRSSEHGRQETYVDSDGDTY